MPLCDRGGLDTYSFWMYQEMERGNRSKAKQEKPLFCRILDKCPLHLQCSTSEE